MFYSRYVLEFRKGIFVSIGVHLRLSFSNTGISDALRSAPGCMGDGDFG
jgi:hypothetical protein